MYLSWDIGIKNLAYCFMDYDNDSKKFTILHWGILNLTDTDNAHHTCVGLIKSTSKICGKKASLIDSNNNYYCATHGKSKPNIKKLDEKLKCIHLKKNKEPCGKNATFKNGISGYCTQHSKKYPECTKISNYKNASKIPLIKIGERLFKELDNHPEFLDAKIVILENQPALKNPTMKSIQMMLFSYFVMKCKVENKGQVEDIILMSAKNKLKAYTGEPITKYDKLKSKYDRTKKLSIEYCKIMITGDEKWYNFFINCKKNDDLADTYLMNCYYVMKKKKIIK